MINLEKSKKSICPAMLFRATVLIFGLSFLIPAPLTAKDGPQSMLELRKLALNFIQSHYTANNETRIKFARWDKRLKLSKCDTTNIQVFYPGKQQRLGNISIGLRCNEKKSWKIYLRVHISIQQNIVYSKRFINRGTVISKDDLVVNKIEVSSVNTQFYQYPKNIIGKVAKRNISLGKRISASSIKPAIVVKRGQNVMIIAKISGLVIRTKGLALSDGVIGQIVKIKNSQSKRELQATVIAPNTVKVNM